MNKNHYLLPKVCPNCGSKVRFKGNKYILCKNCAWMDEVKRFKKNLTC